MFWKRLLLIATLSLLPLSLASAQSGKEEAPSENTAKVEGTPLATVLGDWDAGEGLVINIADDFLRLKNEGLTQDSPMKVKSQDGNKITLQLMDDKGKDAEVVVVDILGEGNISLTWEDGDKKGKQMDLWRNAADRAAAAKAKKK